MDQQRFLQQLQIILDPANGNLKDATSVLQKEFYGKPEAFLFLLQLATTHEDANLRQLAAVEARSLVGKHWLKMTAEQKPQIREQLLRAIMGNNNTDLVRHAIARVVSSIAKIDLPDGEWADLPQFLVQAVQNGNKDERAIAVYIFFTVLESLGEGFEDKFKDLLVLFSKTIRDPESAEVRINTLLALSKLAMHLDSDEDEAAVKAFQEVFPSMVAVLKDAIDTGDEDRIMQAFEVFQTLLGCDPQLMNVHLRDLVTFINEVAANTNLAEDTRTQAISFLMQCVRYRKLRIQGMRIGDQLTRTALHIATELSDDDDDDEITPARSALALLDILSQSLPPSQVVVPLLHSLGQYFNSDNPDYRRAGVSALGVCVEGAPDFLSTQFKEIFPMVLHLLNDAEPKVRRATMLAVARLADDLAVDVGQEHAQLMPLLIQNLGTAMENYKGEEKGPIVEFMKAAIGAIDSVLDGLDSKAVIQYQDGLVPLFHKLFQHPDFKVKSLTATALGSLASSAGEAFLPYFESSMHLLSEYSMKKENEEELDLRASVIDAMGEMSAAAGPENYKPYVQALMNASEEALHLDHSGLKESTYMLWGAISKVYGEEFKPFLDGVVKGLFECIEQEDTDVDIELGNSAKDLVGKEVTIGGRKVKVAAADDSDEDGGIEDIDLDEEDDWEDFTTVTPLALEKEIAIEVIGDVISHTKSAYLPYFEKTVEQLLPLIEHPYEGIRKSTISTLHRAYATLFALAEETGQMPKWQPGLPLQVQPAHEIKKFGEILMKTTIKMWSEEADRTVVSDICAHLSENLRYTGPALIADGEVLQEVVKQVVALIQKKHLCQEDFDEDEETKEMMEETSEFDWIVIDRALDVVSGLAAALGGSFTELWKIFEKSVLRFADSSENIERATAVGVLAEIITGMKNAITPLTGQLLQLLLRRLSDVDPQTKSNAAYAVGRLVEFSEADAEIVKEYPTILSKLEPCLEQQTSRLPDNTTGCLSRMILKHRDQVPIGEVLPAIVKILPLKNDYEENDPLYQMISQLYKWEDQTVGQLTPNLVPIFQEVLSDEEQLEDERRQELIELVRYLNKAQPGIAPWIDQVA